nr:ATP-binding cassette domain-containing protein [Miltoncostaea marina]
MDWRVAPGERWAVVGPNGAGKTTLLSLAGARLHPSEGRVRVLGERLGAVDTRALRAAIGHVDAAMAGRFRPRATALDVVRTGADATIAPLRPDVAPEAAERAEALLDEVGCGRLAAHRFDRLSRGERQRMLLARALVGRPRLLLLDEPTTGLDLPGREAFLARLDGLARAEPALATVQVSHHLEELAGSVTHALLLREGRVVAGGPADEVLREGPLSRCFGAPVALVRRGGRVFATMEGLPVAP